MLTEYINAALKRAHYEILEDSTFYASIPGLQGVYANATTVEACRTELQEVLEEWIVLGFRLGHEIPAIDGIDLNFVTEPVEEVA